jgi:hypothetical protein
MTTPVASPTILFCTLAPTPTLHMSLLEFIIEGAFAVGGVELVTTVLDTVFVSPQALPANNKNIIRTYFIYKYIHHYSIHT